MVVILLHLPEKGQKALMVFRSQCLVHLVSYNIKGIRRVQGCATLKTGGCLLSEEPRHSYLHDHIVDILVDVGKSVDLAVDVRGISRHQMLTFRVLRKLVGHRGRILGRDDDRVIQEIIDFLTPDIDRTFHFSDTLAVLFSCHQSHFFPSNQVMRIC